MEEQPHLRSLADRIGILPAYFDIAGVQQVTRDETRAALLEAMGFDVSTETAAARALEDIERSEQQRLLAPVRVVVRQEGRPPGIQLTIPGHDLGSVKWQIELREENGPVHVAAGPTSGEHIPSRDRLPFTSRSDVKGEGAGYSTVTLSLPVNPPPGYHTLHASVFLPGRTMEAEQSFIVSPGRCTSLSERVGDRRVYGVWANLYTVRSHGNWGLGDLTDLGEIAARAGTHGAAFVGVNPLHTLRNRSDHISPYCPVSRLFRNMVYLHLENVPEFADCREAQTLLGSAAFQAELTDLRAAPHVQYERVAKLKNQVLRLLHGVFLQKHLCGSTTRGRAYTEYIAAQGKILIDFATFVALELWPSEDYESADSWRHWPAEYRRPDTPEVQAFRDAHQEDLEFHCFVQFEIDRQLAAAAHKARLESMALGIYQDLAVGSAGSGSDAWAFPDLFVAGVEVGTPPDPYCDGGQTWGFPPVHPRRLAADRYEYWVRLLRSVMGHAGMIRIDHVMGLFRQFWVPTGDTAANGAYVQYPAEDLLGILALESQRHGVVVVGEDLGTVSPEVPATLAKWEILSSRVMYFERDGAGGFRSAASYSPHALVTATTHDHVPLAGFWTARDLEIRNDIGLWRSNADLEKARSERANTRAALLRLLIGEGLLSESEIPTVESVREAAYTFLSRTPCPLVGVSLDDLGGELDPVNLPGVVHATYASWSRRMRRCLEEIFNDKAVRGMLEQIRVELGK